MAKTQLSVNLSTGSKGADVTTLQNFLVAQGFLTMPAGVSMGYYGKLTMSAVEAFQVKNNIAKQGDAGYGRCGPKTRAAIAGI